jgi:hypothetical protein
MAFSQEIQDLANNNIAPKIVDGILGGNLFAMRFVGNGKKFRGHNNPVEMKYKKSTLGGSYSGMGNFSTAVEANTVKLTWDPKSYEQPVTMNNLDVAVNKNDGVVDYVKYRMTSAQQDMVDDLGDIFYGSGGGSDFDGLAKIIDDGSVSSTYGGQTRSSYDALDANVTTAIGTLELDHVQASISAIEIGKEKPTLIVTTKAIYDILEKLMYPTAQAQYNAVRGNLTRRGFSKQGNGLAGELGFAAISYRGIPVVADDKCTAGYIYYINENWLYWAGLAHPVHGMVNLGTGAIETPSDAPSGNHGIAWTGLKEPINADGQTGQFILYGQMICEQPRFQGVDQGITG